ncbi:MAG TPA: hypothetical protein ENH85_12385 [Candidatus Scalindua sp.]|nr:hypothetical protein [Candidatus Scalindua sp.]
MSRFTENTTYTEEKHGNYILIIKREATWDSRCHYIICDRDNKFINVFYYKYDALYYLINLLDTQIASTK